MAATNLMPVPQSPPPLYMALRDGAHQPSIGLGIPNQDASQDWPSRWTGPVEINTNKNMGRSMALLLSLSVARNEGSFTSITGLEKEFMRCIRREVNPDWANCNVHVCNAQRCHISISPSSSLLLSSSFFYLC